MAALPVTAAAAALVTATSRLPMRAALTTRVDSLLAMGIVRGEKKYTSRLGLDRVAEEQGGLDGGIVQRGVGQGAVEEGAGGRGLPAPLVQRHRGPVAVHRGRVVQAFDLRVVLVDAPRPGPGPVAPAGAEGHGSARAGGPGPGEVEESHGPRQGEASQPGPVPRALDRPGVLEHFREARGHAP